ncbi:MAG: glutamate 5-kinase [Planctomycetaceae bacterium]|nr:glutamate 5-kinase [Planctomycetaceae bacterium]
MPDRQVRQQIIARARRIVVKVGTNAVCDAQGRLDNKTLSSLASQLAAAIKGGMSVTLVASGAIGAGLGELGMTQRPKSMPELQACAAVGQGQLMRAFHDLLSEQGISVGQVLVTRDDFENRTRYLNIRNTLTTLGRLGALPIINENDAVAVDEIRYGDNDIIAAHVANLLGADVLVLLSVVDGVLKDGAAIDVIEQVDQHVRSLISGERSRLGSGGMKSKIEAARMVTSAGEVAVIANARMSDVLTRLLAGQRIGTVFVPARRKMSSRRRWIGQAARAAGKIVIDAGAIKALVQGGKSLLPSGVIAVSGPFPKGANVAILDAAGNQIARGLSNYSSAQIEKIKGLKTAQIARILGDKMHDEVVHRNNMTLG